MVPQLFQYIAQTEPAQRGFTRANLFKMRQLYETCRSDDYRGTAATIVVDTQPHHPWVERTARRTRILSADGDTGAVVEPPVGESGEIGNASLIRNLLIVIPSRLPRDLSGCRGRRQEQSHDGSRDGGLLRASNLQPALVAVDNFFADP